MAPWLAIMDMKRERDTAIACGCGNCSRRVNATVSWYAEAEKKAPVQLSWIYGNQHDKYERDSTTLFR